MRLAPARRWRAIDLPELWRYRELAGFLALRDIRVRYKQTALGAAWAIIQPVFSTLIFTIFFNRLAGVQGAGSTPYALTTFAAMLPWQLFEASVTESSNSLVGSQNLITKVYFPRMVVPLASILTPLVDFCIGFILLLGLMAYFHVMPSPAILLMPLFVLFSLVLSLSIGLWMSALNVQYRDVRYAIPFVMRLWFFVTPVVYDSHKIAEKFGAFWLYFYGLNPMAGVIEGFRWSVLGHGQPPPSAPLLLASAVATMALLIGGLFYFRSMEQTFADIV